MACRHQYASVPGLESAFTVDTSVISFGPGVISEVGDYADAMKMSRIAVFTDPRVRKLECFSTALASFKKYKFDVVVFDEVDIEPTEISVQRAIDFVKDGKFNGFISIGGGSVMDTCKIANVFSVSPPGELLTYVAPPIGKGSPVPPKLMPHIACPTTCGTGAEATAAALFKYTPLHIKTVVSGKSLKPNMALVDPTSTYSLPKNVVMASGFDVLSHAIESYTARPYCERTKPETAMHRPIYQGSNPWGDMGCERALALLSEYFVRAVNDPSDTEARDNMLFAAALAGTAIGNAGTQLPHGMSYAVAGYAKDYHLEGYPKGSLVPHGASVIVNAPSVFRFTASSSPSRHLRCAEIMGADIRGAQNSDAGEILASQIIKFMKETDAPNGISPFGYTQNDLPKLSDGVFKYQRRLINMAPKDINQNELSELFRGALKYW